MASEIGRAQTRSRNAPGVRTTKMTNKTSRNVLEKHTIEGESPVYESQVSMVVSRVVRDTRNLV